MLTGSLSWDVEPPCLITLRRLRGPGREENGSPIATWVSADKAWITDGSCQLEGVFELDPVDHILFARARVQAAALAPLRYTCPAPIILEMNIFYHNMFKEALSILCTQPCANMS